MAATPVRSSIRTCGRDVAGLARGRADRLVTSGNISAVRDVGEGST
jgi:hypothetical protein